MSDVLVDSSVWIDFFRGVPDARRRLDPLLTNGRAAICGPVYAEILSGARERSMFDRLARVLRSQPSLETPPLGWERVAEIRFSLARQGLQANMVDMVIALTALHAGHSLLARDRDFQFIGRAVMIEVQIF